MGGERGNGRGKSRWRLKEKVRKEEGRKGDERGREGEIHVPSEIVTRGGELLLQSNVKQC